MISTFNRRCGAAPGIGAVRPQGVRADSPAPQGGALKKKKPPILKEGGLNTHTH